jgi:hypothetical protein
LCHLLSPHLILKSYPFPSLNFLSTHYLTLFSQIALSVGFWEVFGWKQVVGSSPGDFGVGTKFYDDEVGGDLKGDKLTKELQNGRLAMLGE